MNKYKKISPFLWIFLLIVLGSFGEYFTDKQMAHKRELQLEAKILKKQSLTDKEFQHPSDFKECEKVSVRADGMEVYANGSLTFWITNTSDMDLEELEPFPRLEKKIEDHWYCFEQSILVDEIPNGLVHQPGETVTRELKFTEHEIPGHYRAVFRFDKGGGACEFTVK